MSTYRVPDIYISSMSSKPHNCWAKSILLSPFYRRGHWDSEGRFLPRSQSWVMASSQLGLCDSKSILFPPPATMMLQSPINQKDVPGPSRGYKGKPNPHPWFSQDGPNSSVKKKKNPVKIPLWARKHRFEATTSLLMSVVSDLNEDSSLCGHFLLVPKCHTVQWSREWPLKSEHMNSNIYPRSYASLNTYLPMPQFLHLLNGE